MEGGYQLIARARDNILPMVQRAVKCLRPFLACYGLKSNIIKYKDNNADNILQNNNYY